VAAVTGSLVGLLVGVAMGARHALDPDHLAAVSVLAADAPGARRGALLGALWGIGHAAALLGTGLVLAALAAELPPALGDAFELAVAVMLIVLGARAIHRVLRGPGDGPNILHAHARVSHRHAGPPAHVHVGARAIAWRPLTVGLVHGLAGSGALTALAFAELPTPSARVLYMVVFGAGSIAGMALATGLAGIALQHVARGPTARRWLAISTGLVSCIVGVSWAIG